MQLTKTHRKWQLTVLSVTFFTYIAYYFNRKVFGNVKTSIVEDLGITLGDTANLWTAFLIAYMAGQFINGFFGRKAGPKITLLTGLGISMGCSIVFGLTNSYATFMVFMIINGLVQASGWPGVVGGIAHWLTPKERGTIMGVWSSSYLIGNNIVKWACALFLANGLGWRYAFIGLSAASLLVWIAILIFQRDKPEDVGLTPIITERDEIEEAVVHAAERERITFRDYLGLVTSPVIILMGTSYFCVKFLRYALDSWLPTFLDLQGMDKASAAGYSSIFDFAGLAGAIAAGFMLDRVFNKQWIPLCLMMSIGCVASYGLVIYYGTSPVLLAWLFGGVGFMLYGPDTIICGAASVAVAGERNALAAVGIVNGIGSIGPIVQEQIIGKIVDENDPVASMRNTNYLFLGISVLLAALLLLQLIITRRKQAQAD